MVERGLERNLRLYPWLHVGHSALFWLPVFVLYFSSRLEPADVLRLEAVYYVGVVLFEVPSGYASDRFGRRPTLLIAGVAWALGSLVLAGGTRFAALAVGQLLLATGRAFKSGTDSSLLYDSLVALGRPHELAEREARAQAWGFATLAGSALVGGGLAALDLRFGYALSGIVGLVAVGAAWRLAEPPTASRANSPVAQARAILAQARHPVLRWSLAHAIGLIALIHVPYEILQPWLDAVVDGLGAASHTTPVVSGVVTFVMMGLAALAAPMGPRMMRQLGPGRTLLVAWSLLAGVIAAMAVGPWAALIPLVALRSVPMALADPILAAIAHPELPSELRATWFSMQSLAGRLAFAGLLTGAAAVIGPSRGWTVATMTSLLVPAAVAAATLGVLLWAAQPRDVTSPR